MPTEGLLYAWQAPEGGQLSFTSLVAAYENHFPKRPAAVTDSFFASRGSPLTKALTASHVDIHEGTSENEIRAKTEIKLAQQFEHLEEHYKKAGLISLIKIP